MTSKIPILILLFFAFSVRLLAVNTSTTAVEYSPFNNMTVGDFLSVDVDKVRLEDGKKLKWNQRLAVKMMQKKYARQIKKGKLSNDTSIQDATDSYPSNKFGLLSLIFSIVGLVCLFIPGPWAVLGSLFTIAGLICGIVGLNRDSEMVLAIIGLSISALLLLLFLVVLIAVVTWG